MVNHPFKGSRGEMRITSKTNMWFLVRTPGRGVPRSRQVRRVDVVVNVFEFPAERFREYKVYEQK